MSPPIAVIFGAGPGTGAALARALAPTHRLLLLSRSLPGSLPRLGLDLPDDAVLGAGYDAKASAQSFAAALSAAKDKWPDSAVDVGIVHASVAFAPGPFLERKVDELRNNLETTTQAFDFAQTFIPAMLPSGGTLLFTGATMAVRAGGNFSAMAPGAFARRALAQSLAREFGPRGIHVCHVIVDGLIATENTAKMMGQTAEGERLDPKDIAQVYLDVIRQPRSAWTQELDIRPAMEQW